MPPGWFHGKQFTDFKQVSKGTVFRKHTVCGVEHKDIRNKGKCIHSFISILIIQDQTFLTKKERLRNPNADSFPNIS